ncbi:zinc dependent phospholipase C family protein [Planctomycetota bacterium]
MRTLDPTDQQCRPFHGHCGAAVAVILLLQLLLPSSADAYGPGTHVRLGEESANRIAQADPSLASLVSDPSARACFLYGAVFPDIRAVAGQLTSVTRLKRKLEAVALVKSVRFSTDDVATAFRSFGTHKSEFVLELVDSARLSGDSHKLAFALGNLAHVLQDKHAQVLLVPSLTQRLGCGDLGVEPTEDPQAAGSWYPGYENELVVEGFADLACSAQIATFVRDAPWLLDPNTATSYQRALTLRRFYHSVAASFARSRGRTPPTEQGILNAAKLLEVSATLYPLFGGHEPLADSVRRVVERYVELTVWGSLLNGVVQLVVQNLTGSQDLFDLVAPLIPMSFVAGQVGGQSPLAEILFAYSRGPAEVQRVRSKYGGNEEFQRLDTSGLLDLGTYLAVDWDPCHAMTVDGCTRTRASLFTDHTLWPTYRTSIMRSAAIRSLLRQSGAVPVAAAPDVLVYDLRYEDGTTGQGMREILVPADVGRQLQVEVELVGLSCAAEPRILRLRLRADTGAGTADPVLARNTELLPSSALSVTSYAHAPRPVVTLQWTVTDVAGADGIYAELDERRLSMFPDQSAVDRLLTTELSALTPLMAAGPHYAQHYATYGREMASLRFRR